MANSEWHWTEGNKYALEAIKALLLINGGAAVALLAFAGNFAKEGGNGARIASSLSSSCSHLALVRCLARSHLSLPIILNANTAEAARTTVLLTYGITVPTLCWSSQSWISYLGFGLHAWRFFSA